MKPVWDVVSPARPTGLPGVVLAGFRDGGAASVGQRVIPHPSVMLALDFGPGSPVVTDAAGHELRGSVVAGPGLGFGGSVWVRGAGVECVQVRLSPLLAGAVLGVPAVELDGVVALEDVWGRETARIRERLAETSSWAERFALAETLLERRCAERVLVDPEVAWAWRRILVGGGRLRVETLADEVGWSRKRLWSRFRAQVGLPPKRAAQLVRFDRAVHRLVAGEVAARVAAEGGYADQSHLHRDVAAFAGTTPTAVAREPWLAVDDVAWPGEGGTGGQDAARTSTPVSPKVSLQVSAR
ncbi:AraC family transcriptional regulator [Streptacidiphilus pinicola]|uniref:AraC family transcriptional regulator n=1 Tax=Streptacidiphilus pinicola TaxID=2219663 RepID=A0A2X0ID95_9ACTN|nr:helix-turn-helix domain-containing protein [Streptacidiphilus pinicola]RAG82964.1 AraC family transcriptional regulator [Streptacidiphilus pinicola]